jgi:hypothetical protein
MGYQKIQMITMLDLEKIALWLQARLYPYPVHKGEEVSLALPFTSEGLHYFPGNYKAHWEKIVGAEAFDFSYQRVLGKKQGHQTNLLIGLNISAELSDKDVQQFSQVIQLKTPLQEAYNTLFHRSISQELPQKKETEVPVARDSSKAETMPGFFSATVTKKTNTSPQGIDCVL